MSRSGLTGQDCAAALPIASAAAHRARPRKALCSDRGGFTMIRNRCRGLDDLYYSFYPMIKSTWTRAMSHACVPPAAGKIPVARGAATAGAGFVAAAVPVAVPVVRSYRRKAL